MFEYMESTLHYFYNIVVNLSMLNYVRTLTLKKKKKLRTYIKYYNYTYCVYYTALEK
jgi:hypothetical protein